LISSGRIKIITTLVFLITGAAICVLVVLPDNFFAPEKKEWRQSRLIEPTLNETGAGISEIVPQMAYENSLKPVLELNDGEAHIKTLSEDFDGDGADEQIIVYRNLLEKNNPVYITYVDYDAESKTYKRLWSASGGITKQGTLSLFTMDLTGNHTNELVVSGMNQADEQVLTVFKINKQTDANLVPYKKIVDLTIDGTINIITNERSQAYQLGFARGASFNITDRGRDESSSNALDQIENTYSYDPIDDMYEKSGTVKIQGAQIEARRLKELLSGDKQEFEQFIDGLWYHISSEGTINNAQYIYFDTSSREIIFYGDNAQQVYQWLSSYPTRYGLYISSKNISVTTLERKVNLELESLESIRIKVSEDVRMRILMQAQWDGSYRKADMIPRVKNDNTDVKPFINAEYESPIGRITFSSDGAYTIELNGTSTGGKYSFFPLEGGEFLELIPAENFDNKLKKTITRTAGQDASGDTRLARKIYKVGRSAENDAPEITLKRVRLTTGGVSETGESDIPLSRQFQFQ
jgi:hypothetical protein